MTTERTLPFVKMQGLGNDFVLIDLLEAPREDAALPGLAQKMCDRHFGIGADGLLLVLPSRVAEFQMRIFNADGSEAEMCGNGIRCFAKYVYESGLTTNRELEIETLGGIVRPRLSVKGTKVESVRVDTGSPRLERKEIPMKGKPGRVVAEKLKVAGKRYEITAVSMGNPHCVLFVDDVEHFQVAALGPAIERLDLFPHRTNVEFVQCLGPNQVRMRVWERGVGETLACGSGAAAAAVAGTLNGLTARKIVAHLPGGDLEVEWNDPTGHVFTSGPAAEVFRGQWPLTA